MCYAIMMKAGAELPEERGTAWLRLWGAGTSGGGSTVDEFLAWLECAGSAD